MGGDSRVGSSPTFGILLGTLQGTGSVRPLIVQFSARTDTGRVRAANEDNYLVDRKLKLYVVCDGLTTGAGAAFVMLANRSGRARTVGEETGSNASSFCSGEVLEVTLPRSGCILHVPLKRYVPEGTPDGPMDRGEMPKYKVPQRPEDLPQGTDSVREALVHLITEMQ